ncbi:TPA: UvrD-helicase domain-containing protein [Vibrio parahaemolyticus]
MTSKFHMIYDEKVLSNEQAEIVSEAHKGRNIIINAFAGTGKTLTLRAISSLALGDKKGLYLAFNKKIVDEASAIFPSNVECRTVHSLAYRSIASKYVKTGRLKQYLTPGILCDKVFQDIPSMYGISAIRISGMILSVIQRFCQSAALFIEKKHLNHLSLSDVEVADHEEVLGTILYFANAVWELLVNPQSDIPITPDVYLKLWALKSPQLQYDFILIDEAQDQTPVVIDVLSKQDAQQVWVGDKYQQIYGFRGAENALGLVDIESSFQLTQSFRYGEAIAKYSNHLINFYFNESTNIRGLSTVNSRVSEIDEIEPQVVICRTNFGVISELAYQTYIEKKNVAINGDIGSLNRDLREAEKLMLGVKTSYPEFAPFKDWHDLVIFSKSDEGIHLRTLVNLVEQYDISLLLDLLNRAKSINEKYADIVVSTVHQVKGREWDVVRLADDFRGKGHSKYSDEEARLLYVAATRARSILDISLACAAHIPRGKDTIEQGKELQDERLL